MNITEIKIGDLVLVRPGFGAKPPITALVTNVESDIKNGQSGIDYTDPDGGTRWAYLDQVDAVLVPVTNV